MSEDLEGYAYGPPRPTKRFICIGVKNSQVTKLICDDALSYINIINFLQTGMIHLVFVVQIPIQLNNQPQSTQTFTQN